MVRKEYVMVLCRTYIFHFTREEIAMLNQNELEILALYAQVVSPILAALGIVVSWIIYIGQKRKERKARAIDMGLEIEPIMHLIGYISRTFETENKELCSILLNADRSKMKLFEYDEMRTVYSEKDLKVIKKYFPERIEEHIRVGGPAVASQISSETLIKMRSRYYDLFSKSLDELEKDNREKILEHEFRQIIVNTLNKLETLCLRMIKKVADEKAIYQAMHPNFIAFVSLFYYYISCTNRNVTGDDKKLKHVIQIYNKWRKRHIRNLHIQMIKNKIKNAISISNHQ